MARLVTSGMEGGSAPAEGAQDEWASDAVLRFAGTWSAVASAVALALGAGIYVLDGRWPGMAIYATRFNNAQLIVWVFFALLALFFVCTVVSIHAATPERRRLFSSAGLGFTLMYATICVSTCVLQFTYVRYRINDGDLAALEPWTSASTKSATFALDNVAFFLQGIATLCLAPLFGGTRITNAIRWLFVANGVGCLGLILLASFMGFETAASHALYLATTLVWAALLGAALILVAVAFHRGLLTRPELGRTGTASSQRQSTP